MKIRFLKCRMWRVPAKGRAGAADLTGREEEHFNVITARNVFGLEEWD